MLRNTTFSTCNNCLWFRIRGADASWDVSEGKWVPKDIVCRCHKDRCDSGDPTMPEWFYVEEWFSNSCSCKCESWTRRRRPLKILRRGEHA